MVPFFLTISGLLTLLVAVSIIAIQYYRIKKGKVVIDESYNGPLEVSSTLRATFRYGLKRSIHFRKFMMQYFFHTLVRVMHYVDIGTTYLYAKSRNWFVKNAVRNRGTVPHFWQHLKVYKQEMDKEKKEEEEE